MRDRKKYCIKLNYCGEELPCINVVKGDTYKEIFKKINDAICEVIADEMYLVSANLNGTDLVFTLNDGSVVTADLSDLSNMSQYTNTTSFPAVGSPSKIYLAKNTGKIYWWTGTAYSEITGNLALGITSTTAYRGDRGKIAYDHSQLTSGNPHKIGLQDALAEDNKTGGYKIEVQYGYPIVFKDTSTINFIPDTISSIGTFNVTLKPESGTIALLSDLPSGVPTLDDIVQGGGGYGGYLSASPILIIFDDLLQMTGDYGATFTKFRASNTADRIQTFPDKTGTIALLSDIPNPANADTGTAVKFDKNYVYGDSGTPETGNITQSLTGALLGTSVKIYHNASSEPTYPSGWVELGTGGYVNSQLNIIYAENCGGGRVEYWVVQEK